MGALTDSRKRLSADHRVVPSFPPSPPSKKPRFHSLTPAPPPSVHPSPSTSSMAASAAGAAASSGRRRLPPPPPVARPIHAPQRIRRAFRGGPIRPPPEPSPPSLGLQHYVELVNSVSHPPTPRDDANVARAAGRAAEAPVEVVVEDEGEREEEEEEVRARVVVRRVPLYRELYETSSRLRDARLRSLEFEVQLAEKSRLGLERLKEVLPQIAPKKEV